jgi:hypothetical protein
MLSIIRRGLDELAVSRDRFIHIEYVPSLWTALLELGVDAYLGSFPLGGGRATIEAMGAGLPLIIHENYRSHFFSVQFEVYRGAAVWRNDAELIAAVTAFASPGTLQQHARASRSYYEDNHTLRLLQERMSGRVGAMPVKPDHNRSQMQSFLDEHVDLLTYVNWRVFSP